MSEGEIYRKLEQKKHNIGDDEEHFEIVPFEAIKPILDEAKKEIYADLFAEITPEQWRNDAEKYPAEPQPRAIVKILKLFGEP